MGGDERSRYTKFELVICIFKSSSEDGKITLCNDACKMHREGPPRLNPRRTIDISLVIAIGLWKECSKACKAKNWNKFHFVAHEQKDLPLP